RPRHLLRQLANRRLMREHRSGAHELRPHVPQHARYVAIAPRVLPESGRIDLEFHEMAHGIQRIAKQESGPRDRAEQIAAHREAAALDARVEDGRPAGAVDAPLNLRRLEIWIDLVVQADELSGALEINETFAEAAIGHGVRSPSHSCVAYTVRSTLEPRTK